MKKHLSVFTAITMAALAFQVSANEQEFTVYTYKGGKSVGIVLVKDTELETRLERIVSSNKGIKAPSERCTDLFVAKRSQGAIELGLLVLGKDKANRLRGYIPSAEDGIKKDAISCKVKISTTMAV
ncbi:MAG: hypothetical protein ACTS9Y_00470 [Methylophilus sp.]|uniref:hypothetical protein n=1 Tax=Methylophilus sp. TaxID=29541 RepID=UPI003F9EED2E